MTDSAAPRPNKPVGGAAGGQAADDQPAGDQLSLLGAEDVSPIGDAQPGPARKPGPVIKPQRKPSVKPAPEPVGVAQVVVDHGLAHLDRPFDYSISEEQDDQVQPGCRVKVRFAGRRTDALVVSRSNHSTFDGKLAPIDKVVSAEPVLTPETWELVQSVAERYGGTTGDVLRLAIPARHARAEAEKFVSPEAEDAVVHDASWLPYHWGREYLTALADGEHPRAVMSVLPGQDPAATVAAAVAATIQSGRGAIVCVPDAVDVEHWSNVFRETLGASNFVVMTAATQPIARYRAFLRASRGQARVVLGTRTAAYAPVHNLGLVCIWDDGDDLYCEPRAPYPHTREVLLLRAAQSDAGVLLAAYSRSVEAQSLIASSWCVALHTQSATRRTQWPRVIVADPSERGAAPVRLPALVTTKIRQSAGPILVQVPRRGYRFGLACQTCREPARCGNCQGPLIGVSASQPPQCRWCAQWAAHWVCPHCSGRTLRAPIVGATRTAEEFSQSFPQHSVVTSSGESRYNDAVTDGVIVLATPGAEPNSAHGYQLVVLLDTSLALARDDLRVVEETHRRWFNALALAAPGASAVAVGELSELQALVRADPEVIARSELETRSQTRMPPVARMATVEGPLGELTAVVDRDWTAHTDILGPVDIGEDNGQLILRSPRSEGLALASLLKQVAAERSAAKLPALRIQVDPHVI